MESIHPQYYLVEAFEKLQWCPSAEVPWVSPELDKKKPLRSLTTEQDGTALFQWLGELLVENKQRFPRTIEFQAQ